MEAAIMMHRPVRETEDGDSERGASRGSREAKWHLDDGSLTSDELEDARDGEPLPFAEGEELSHEHEDAQDGEDAGEDRSGLHRLEVFCRGSQRETSQGHTQ